MKSASVVFVAGVLALTFCGGQDALAQWSADPTVGVVVCAAPGHQQYPHIVSDSAGGSIIGWSDERNGNSDIYAQRVDASGNVRWVTNGIAISTSATNEYGPFAVSDGSHGAILVWENVRDESDRDILAQRVNSSGEIQWGSGGVAVVSAPGFQTHTSVASGGSGSAIIAWDDSREGVYVQKITSLGGARWALNGVRVAASLSAQVRPDIVSDGAGGAIITWYDNRIDGRTFDIYAQRIDSSGNVQWGTDGVAICSATGEQSYPVIVSDRSGGAILAWQDNRDSAGTRIYAQKVNASGIVQWTTDGVCVSSETGNNSYPNILSDESGGAIISWRRAINGTYSCNAQKIDGTGTVRWTIGGVAVSTTNAPSATPAVAGDGSGGAIISWPTYLDGINDIYAQRITASGTTLWVQNGVGISMAPYYQINPAIISDGSGGAVITWQDARNGTEWNIQAQRVDRFGNLYSTVIPPPTITSFSPASGPIGTALTIAGTNFNPIPANNIVWFGAVRAAVTGGSATSLTVTVPYGTTYAPISVTDSASGLTAYSSKPFVVTFPSSQIIENTSFTPKVDFATGSYPGSVAIGDLDGDGKPDLVVSNYSSNTVSVFRNINASGSVTAGSFTAKVDFVTGTNPYTVAIGDLDGDGKLDLAVTDFGSNAVSVFRNTSNAGSITANSFAAKVDFTAGSYPYDVAIGDLDGDGKPDLAITNTGSNTVSVFRNTSSSGAITAASFATKVDFATGAYPYIVAIGDLDGDGKPDLAAANVNSNSVSVFRNTSTSGSIRAGSFASKVDFTTGAGPISVAIGDMNGDGKSDLAVANYNSNTISVFRNTSSSSSITASSFASKVDFTTGAGPRGVAICDLDGDGKPDLAAANLYSNTVSLFRNTSTSGSITIGSFAVNVDFAAGAAPMAIAIADMDGDGKPDLVAADSRSNTLSVLRNAIGPPAPTIASFSPTSGPITTSVTITGANFNSTPVNNIVYFGAVRAAVTGGTSSSLTVNVPYGATYAPISITDSASGLTAYSSRPFVVTFPSSRIIDVASMSSRVDFATGEWPVSVAIGDLDGDGKPDLAVGNYNSNTVSIFRNISSSGSITAASFATKVDFATGLHPQGVAIGDLDGDGKPDLAVTNGNSGTVSVFRNTSVSGSITSGSFASKVDFATGLYPMSVAIFDLDGDGKLDLAIANGGGNTISVLRNTSSSGSITSGCFAAKVDFATGTAPNSVAICDLDGDGKPDLGVANINSSTVSVFRNVGVPGSITSSSFATKVDFETGAYPWDIAIGDVDGDGKSDLVTSNTGSVSVLRNTCSSGFIGLGSFAAKVDFATGGGSMSIAIGDIDGDGKPDLAVGDYGNYTVSVFRNTSSSGSVTAASFDAKVDFAVTAKPSCVALGDIDGDGKQDIVATCSWINSSNVSVMRNVVSPPAPAITSISPTSGPIGTSVTISGANFNSTLAKNIVYFGAVRANVMGGSTTSLTVNVPYGTTYAPISVTDSASGLTAYSSKPFTVTFTSSHIIDAVTVAPKVDFTTGADPRGIAIGDLDGDGKPDLAVVSMQSDVVSIFRNTSISGSLEASSFAAKVDFATGMGPNSVAIGDLDGDGKPDLAVTNNNSITVSVFKNTSSSGSITAGSFASKVDFATGIYPQSVAIGDLDGDGKADLVVTNSEINTVSVFRNTCYPGSITAASFASKVDFETERRPVSVGICDLDGDEKLDLAVVSVQSARVSILRNSSSPGSIKAGSFDSKVDFPTGANPYSVAIGDLDGDGKPDLATANSNSNTVSVFRNTSSPRSITTGSFEAQVNFATGEAPFSVAIGDFDGDGRLDLATANRNVATVSILRNTSSLGIIAAGSFASKVDFMTGIIPFGVAVGDLDGDAKPDLVTCSATNTVSVLHNMIGPRVSPTIAAISPTSGPIGTVVTLTGANFNPVPAKNIVYFGAVRGTVLGGNSSLLTVTVPHGTTYAPISVTDSASGLTAYSNKPFNVTFPSVRTIEGGSIAPKTDFVIGTYPYDVAISDLDGDGKLDLIGANGGSSVISIFRNTSSTGTITSSSFATRIDFSVGLSPRSIAVGDLDGDGKPDLAVANSNGNSISVLRNTSVAGSLTSSSFAPAISLAIGTNPFCIAIGDLDGDGKPDLVITKYFSSSISIFKNTSTPGSIAPESFGSIIDFEVGPYPTSVAIGDLNGDGRPDVAVTNQGSNTISVLRNIAMRGFITTSSFAAKADFPTGSNPSMVAISDLDGDGKPDLAVSNYNSNTLSILRNTCSSDSINVGSFAAKVDLATEASPYAAAVSDLDGDGRPDIVAANYGSNNVSVFRNVSSPGSITTGSFGTRVDFTTGTNPCRLSVGDIDGDGRPDIVVPNWGGSSISIMRNNIFPIGAPANLSVRDTTSHQIAISWSKNSSSYTLRYRIYRSTSPGATTLVDSTSGASDTTKTMTGLTNGTRYYFRVTAVDSAGNESDYSNEVNAVPGDYIAPATPQNLTATAGAGEVMLRWKKNGEPDFLLYLVCGGSSPNPTTLVKTNSSVLDTSALITGLTNGTTYYFRIKAVDSMLNASGWSNEVSATPAPTSNVSTQPVDTATGQTPATITFTNLIQNGTTELQILSSITPPPPPLMFQIGNPATYYEITTTAVFSGSVNVCFNYTGVSYVKESKLKLLHREATGWVNTTTDLDTANNVICGSVTSLSPFVIMEPETVPPVAPANLTATASPSVDRRIDLSWKASASDDVTGYLLYRSDASITDTTGRLLARIRGATNFADVVSNYGKYFYEVFAQDSLGNISPASNEASATAPDHLAPAAPQGLAVTDSSCKTLGITWLKSLEKDFMRYRVYRDTFPEPITMVDSTRGGNADTSKTLVGLTNGTQYYVRVTAVDSSGNESTYSREVNATPADREPPTIKLAHDPIVLWPPNHQYRTIKVLDFVVSVTDACAGEIPLDGVIITKVTSDEPEDVQENADGKSNTGGGDGSTLQDIVINPDCRSVGLRSERLGGGNGRVYTIHVAVRDPSSVVGGGGGNLARATFLVQVPCNEEESIVVDDGVAYSVASVCEAGLAAQSSAASEETSKQPIPSEFGLEQNYPNPFNPSTIIRYSVPVRSHVRLQIYDLLGREVMSLVDEEQGAQYYEKIWRASVSSGLYFYRLEAISSEDPKRSFVQVRKMILLR